MAAQRPSPIPASHRPFSADRAIATRPHSPSRCPLTALPACACAPSPNRLPTPDFPPCAHAHARAQIAESGPTPTGTSHSESMKPLTSCPHVFSPLKAPRTARAPPPARRKQHIYVHESTCLDSSVYLILASQRPASAHSTPYSLPSRPKSSPPRAVSSRRCTHAWQCSVHLSPHDVSRCRQNLGGHPARRALTPPPHSFANNRQSYTYWNGCTNCG